MVQLAELHQALAAASDPISLIRTRRRRLRLRDRPSDDCAPGRHAPAVGRIGELFCRGSNPCEWSSTRVSRHRRLREGRNFEVAGSSCDRGRRRVLLQRGAEINSAGGYLRALTRKSEGGDVSLGPILMAQINSRRRDKKRA